MAFEPFNLADVYLKAESAKGAQQARETNQFQMQQAQRDAHLRDIMTLGSFSEQLLQNPDPVTFYNQSLPQLRGTVTSPELLNVLNPTNDPNELLSEAQQLVQLARSLPQQQKGNEPAGWIEFQRYAQAAGLDPNSEEYKTAARIQLQLQSGASRTRVLDVNGVPTLVGVQDNGLPFQVPLSDLQTTADASGAIKESEALGTGRGKTQAEQEADLPKTVAASEQMLSTINLLRDHPGKRFVLGAASVLPIVPGTPQADFMAALEQSQGQVFLQAYQQLKGGGQITEVEGKKAEQAIARLSRAQSVKAFDDALNDLEEIVTVGLLRARRGAGAEPSQATQPADDLSEFQVIRRTPGSK